MKQKSLLIFLTLSVVTAVCFSFKVDQNKELIKTVELGPINQKMVGEGKGIFNSKCMMCHDLDQKKVGPTLRSVTKVRKPEYVMNVLLNSTKMQKEDPTMKDLVAKYNKVPMPETGLNQTQARSVLEYLRSVAK
jgi:cytochrome c2